MIKSALQSSLTNDVKYRNLDTFNVPSNEYLIETVLLGSNAASVTFSNLGQYAGVYRHLQIRYATLSTLDTWLNIRVNASTTDYYSHRLQGEGSVSSGASNSTSIGMQLMGLTGTSSVPGRGVFDILDPFNSNKKKVVRGLTGGPNTVALTSGMWNNTAAVTSLELVNGGGNFAQYSRFSLYGVTA